MNISFILIVAIVLLMLAAERLSITALLKQEKYRDFIRRHPILHPNGISILRLPQGIIAIALAHYCNWEIAIIWFAFWMITDLTDGTIARACDLASETGAWLDPFSDKCMSFPALFYMALAPAEHFHGPTLSLWAVIAYCSIDVIGQASRLFCSKKAANSFGKVKTALITVLISLLAINQLLATDLIFMNDVFVGTLTISCIIFAFLSLYCKVIPNHWYANTLTLLNFLCGLAAIWTAICKPFPGNSFLISFLLVFVGQFFDLFDGRLARKYGSTKRGPLFDDIADGTSFGLAVGLIVFLCLSEVTSPLNLWGAGFIALFYIVSLIYRLYRFLHPTMQMPAGIFQGLPAPAGALLTGSFIVAASKMNTGWAIGIAAAVTVISSFLMVSNLPYRHFGQNLWPSLPKGMRCFLLILTIIFGCFAVASRDWATAFIWFTAVLALCYSLGAIASKKLMAHLRQLEEEKSKSEN
jgi:CDP-diacylglycerol--serine O-phosphatidyltransferase